MRRLVTLALLGVLCSTAAAAAECPVGDIEKVLTAPPDGLKVTERQVTDIQSTEGGVWRIYRDKDGSAKVIMRLDGGESGMSERRLGILANNAYGISVTRVDYLRHAFVDGGGPNGTAKRTTEYFYFCGGKLYLPPPEFSTPYL